MLNDLNALIGFEIELKISSQKKKEIELKIRGSTIYSQNLLSNYFILLQLYINTKLFFSRNDC